MNMGPRAAPTLEASQSRAGRAPGPIQEASRPAGCPACLASPQPAAAGPPLASSPQPVGSGAVHPPPSVDRPQDHLPETGGQQPPRVTHLLCPRSLGALWTAHMQLLPEPLPAGGLCWWGGHGPSHCVGAPDPLGAGWGLQAREAGGEFLRPGLHAWGSFADASSASRCEAAASP